jgi:putative FmdB family regulatory protein
MPTYEYKCLECGHRFDAFQKMSDAPLEVCPECGGKVKRVIGAGAGIIFKGSGFYETDYKKSHTSTNSKKVDSNSTETKGSDKKESKSENTKTSTDSKSTKAKAS